MSMGGPAAGIRMATMEAAMAVVVVVGMMTRGVGEVTWCIARSAAGTTALQTALDYACGSGAADCTPVQSSGLCYLPNSLAAHASYAFNSYYQRSKAAPGACDFAGTATVTITDPSYGSCTYPSSASTAGGSTSTPRTNTPSNTPATTSIPPSTPNFGSTDGGVGGLSPPGFGSTVPNADTSIASPMCPHFLTSCLYFISLLI
ncbi:PLASMODESMATA CALLOSE-BINDING PROTEIN 3-like isoform X1 [Musa acuminata AAA Group]|uniref:PLASMODESMATA CALLOSE-BINDING PROTEIN 3-like isoform X1 n=1 Tax=Musa acuminata AAA Group TaxID=214697 RepID=UPI0031D359CB